MLLPIAIALRNFRLIGIASALLCASATLSAQVSDTPVPSSGKRLEYGLGLGVVQGPDYLGSKQVRTFISPFPYVIYRGKKIQADRGGLRGQLFRSERVDLTLSVNATISPDADRNSLREQLGLDALGSSLEFGPALNLKLWQSDNQRHALSLMLPLRAMLSIGGNDAGAQGFTAQPHVFYRHQYGDWQLSWRSGLSFASRDYHAYYYQLPASAAQAQYPAYEARAGFGGLSNTASVSRQFGKLRTAVFVRHDYLADAVFADSPLVETQSATRAGLALLWTLN